MRVWYLALLVFLGGCALFGAKQQRPSAANGERRVAHAPTPSHSTHHSPPPAQVEKSSSSSGVSVVPPAPAVRQRPQAAGNGPKRPDGVAASSCIATRRTNGFLNDLQVYARNACSVAIEVRAACLPSYAEANDPYPGTYALDSWLFTLGFGQEQAERQSAICYRRGGKVLYAACHVGSPYFTSPDGSKFGCFRHASSASSHFRRHTAPRLG